MEYWADLDPKPVIYAADDETFNPCPAIHTKDGTPGSGNIGGGLVVRVPVALDEIELARLAKGGTLWLSMWGGLAPWMLDVQARGDLLDPACKRSD